MDQGRVVDLGWVNLDPYPTFKKKTRIKRKQDPDPTLEKPSDPTGSATLVYKCIIQKKRNVTMNARIIHE